MSDVVIGFSKCGITSLKRYLGCANPEIAYRDDGIDDYLRNYSDCTPHIITRDPVKRVWSAYNYFPILRQMSFEKFLDHRGREWQGVGCDDVIDACDYEKYVDRWRPYGVVVHRLEDMVRLPDFPHINEGHTPPMPDAYHNMVIERLERRGILL